jgi:cytoskeletal protein RodZ
MPTNYPNPQDPNDLENRRRLAEEQSQYQRERAAEEIGTSNGLLIGSLLVGLAGLSALGVYYFNRPTPTPTPTTIINTTPAPAASVSPAPQKTTIIDRTIEKTAPPQVKTIEKPVAVPGATKVIEVPKPATAPTTPSTTDKSSTPTTSPTPSAQPSTPASDSSTPTGSPSPNDTAPANNN